MGIEAGIYARLTGSTDVTGIVGTRIFPGRIPEGQQHPHIRFMIQGGEVTHTLTAHTSLNEASVQIDCYTDNSYLDCVTLAEKVRNTFNTNSTSFGTIQIERSHVTSELDEPPFQLGDGSDNWIFGRSLDIQLHFFST